MKDLWERLPRVRRARGWRLYGEGGVSYLDLWGAGGQALLGHRPFRITTTLKDVISRGTLLDLPSVYGPRLEKALRRLFPAFPHVRLEAGPQEALAASRRRLGVDAPLHDPLREGRAAGPICLWRPFSPPGMRAEEAAEVRALLPVLPFGMGGAPAAVLFRDPPPATGGEGAPPPLSPVLLAGALRALHDLDRYRPAPWFREDLLAGCPGWVQRGIYFLPAFPPERYEAVFERFLEGRVLLPPRFGMPGILPAEASAGERKRMLELFSAFPGG